MTFLTILRRALPLALLLAPVGPASAPALAQAQTGDLALVREHLRAVQSMTAGFLQTDRNGKSLLGTITLKKPGKVRFQYQAGVPILIVGDGKALWFIDYSVRQASRWPIGNSPLSVLLDPDKDIARVAKVVPSPDASLVTVEAVDPGHPEYGRITLVFVRNRAAPGGLMLQGWVALDAQGNRTTVRLNGQKFNVAVSDATFRWTDPRTTSRPG